MMRLHQLVVLDSELPSTSAPGRSARACCIQSRAGGILGYRKVALPRGQSSSCNLAALTPIRATAATPAREVPLAKPEESYTYSFASTGDGDDGDEEEEEDGFVDFDESLDAFADDVAVGDGVAESSESSEEQRERINGSNPDVAASEDEPNPSTTADALSAPLEGIGGEAQLEALLAEGLPNGEASLTVDRLVTMFPFQLDGFQKSAVQAFLDGRSVVICAPTGAGKTAIAEAAAAAALLRGQRVIYTTPLKALSNQKLFETRRRFGTLRCGLQTGDTSLNTEADIVVMTTEILRNIMYRTAENVDNVDGGAVQAAREARLGDVGLVVLDEVHYLGDPSRGSVWEEVIINCPRHIQLLCMSATVKNPDDLGAWISKEHQECATIKTRFRPVPLNWHFAYRANNTQGATFVPLLDKAGKALNPKLDRKTVAMEEARMLMQNGDRMPRRNGNRGYEGGSLTGGRGGRNVDDAAERDKTWERTLRLLLSKDGSMLQKNMKQRRVPDILSVVLRLQKLEWLPAIWFILSRKDCDLSAIKVGALQLTSAEEKALIASELEALTLDQPDAVRQKLIPPLLNGIASHHAGQLPGWKGLIEKLFQRGLIKLIFATGTLAAGINMPARTTLISALGRKTDDGPRPLPHNELLQMAGRAGRRGYDTVGHCVVLQNRFEGADEAWQILRSGPEPIESQFSISYSLALNLLSVYSLEEAKKFVSRSFGHFMQTEGSARKLAEIADLEAQAKVLMADYSKSASSTATDLNASVKALREQLSLLKARALEARTANAAAMLRSAGMPRQVLLNLARRETDEPFLVPALILGPTTAPPRAANTATLSGTQDTYYAALSADNRMLKLTMVHVASLVEGEAGSGNAADAEQVLQAMDSVPPTAWQTYQAGMAPTCLAVPGTAATAQVAMQVQTAGALRAVDVDASLSKQVTNKRAELKKAVKALDKLRHEAGDTGTATAQGGGKGAKRQDSAEDKALRARRLLKKADTLRQETQRVLENTWRSFTEVVEILVACDALEKDTLRLLPLGLAVRSLQGQNELWLALALTHPSVPDLTGPQLAALLGAILSSEVMKRPDALWAAYSASDKVVRVVEDLEPVRDMLFALQSDGGLARWNEYLVVDLRMAGIVEAWAAGATWQQIMTDSTVDDGDVARLLIRTTDLLRQVVNNKQMLPYLRETALDALVGMDRKPVAELVK